MSTFRRVVAGAVVAAAMMLSAKAMAGVTTNVAAQGLSVSRDSVNTAVIRTGVYGDDLGWSGVLNQMAYVESNPGLTSMSGFQNAKAYWDCAFDTGWTDVLEASYNREKHYLTVDTSAYSPSNGYVEAWVEWNMWFTDDGIQPATKLGGFKQPVPLGKISRFNLYLWPDFNPGPASQSNPYVEKRAVTLNFNGPGEEVPAGQPRLMVSQLIAETQPRTNTLTDMLARHGDPIDGINGNVSIDETDIAVATAGPPLEFRRSYSTVLDGDGSLGPRWSHSYLWRIWETNTVFNGSTNRWLVLRAGEDWHWKALAVTNGGHEIVDAAWRWDWTKTNDAYVVVRPGGFNYRFDTNGVLTRIDNAASNALSLTYTNLGGVQRLRRVEHGDGRALQFGYDASNRLEQVSLPFTNLSVRFDYSPAGLPTSVVRTAGANVETTRYDWNTATQVITQRLDSAGVPRVWEYDGTMGTRSYVGTGRWFEVSLDYSLKAENRTQIMTHRGDTNTAFYQDYDPLRNKIMATSDALPWGLLQWSFPPDSVITNCWLFTTGDRLGLLTMNPQYVSAMAEMGWGNGGSNITPSLGWSGTRYTRDDSGCIVGVEQRSGDPAVNAWTKSAIQLDAAHRTTNWAFGYMAEPTNAWQVTWNTNWDVPASVIDPEGHRVEWDYTNGLVSVVRAFPATNQPVETRYAYTTNGLLAAVTNANGHWVRCQYDGYGYPTSVIPQAGPTNGMVWDSLGHLRELRLAGNGLATNQEPGATVPRRVSFDPDELGRIRRVTWPDNTCDTFAYDAVGNLTNHTDAAGRQTGYAWLPTRKLAAVTRDRGGLAATTRLEYDQQFNTKRVIDELGRTVESYRLDLQDRPVTVTNVDGRVMTVNWGLTDFVRSIVRFDGTTNTFAYDTGGRLSQVAYPDATLAFRYLRNGLPMTASNAMGVVSNAYDGANRLVAVSQPVPSGTVAYSLHPSGQVSNTVSVAGTNAYLLDAADRVATITSAKPGMAVESFQYGYNSANGLAASVGYPNGLSCAATCDKMDRVTALVWKNASNQVIRSRAYAYSAVGMVTNAVYETGEQVAYTYDSLDRLTGERHLNTSGQVVSDETYGYDLAGNRTNKTVWAGATPLVTVNYAPGAGNRLASWSVAETDLVGQVDVAGVSSEAIGVNDRFGWLYVSNLNAVASVKPYVAGTNFWAYDLVVGLGTQSIVAAIRDPAGNTTWITNQVCLTVVTNGTYQYSAAGCVTNVAYQGKDFASTLGLTWDGQYQLTAVATNGTVAERYGYDAYGRRAWTWDAANGTNWHVYDGPHVVADLNGTGGLLRAYTYGPGIDNILAITEYGTTTSTVYYVKDHLGSVLVLVDKDGMVVESYRYDAWGRTTVYDAGGNTLSRSSYGNRYLWQGREYSWGAGIYHFRARWYDPVTGRWLSNDPIGISGGLNQYVFCANNPVNRRDPRGLTDLGDIGAAFGIYNPDVFVGEVMAQAAGAQSQDQIRGQIFFHEVAKGWLAEAAVGAIPVGAAAAEALLAVVPYVYVYGPVLAPYVTQFLSGWGPTPWTGYEWSPVSAPWWVQPAVYLAGWRVSPFDLGPPLWQTILEGRANKKCPEK